VSRLRVLTVSDVTPLTMEGGGERALWELAAGLAARGHGVRVLSRAPAGVTPRRRERDGVVVQEFAARRHGPAGFVASAILGARRAAAPLLADTDVLHVHQPVGGWGVLGSPAARGVPSLYTFHSPAPLEYRSRRRMTPHHLGGVAGAAGMLALWLVEGACLRRATRIHVLSDFSASLLWQLYRIPADRIVKIPGGADLERFRPAADRRQVRAALGLPLERPLLLTVRNLEARMGLDTLVAALGLVARREPEALLLVGGAGSLREVLQAQVRLAGLDKHVAFLGFVPEDDLVRYYQVADAFVLPTRELEGFGLVTAEALACGTPVLGTRVGATPELLESLDPALVLSDGTAEAMAEDLCSFLDRQRRDPAAAAALRAACRRHAEAHYGWAGAAAGLEATLAELAGRRPVTPPTCEPCEACGTMLRASGLVYGGRRYCRCPRCGARRLSTLPSAGELRREYEGSYPRRFPPAHLDAGRRALLDAVLAGVQARVPPGWLLDVGCAGGRLVGAARAHGWRAIGSDLSLEACRAAGRAAGAPAVQARAEALPFRTGFCDALTLVNVLDHTARPGAVVREAARVLRPGGLLVLRVPNAAFHAPWVRLLGRLGPLVRCRRWDTYPILHVFAFGPTALRRLLEGGGFEVAATVNSGLVAASPGAHAAGPGATARRLLRALTAVAAGVVHALSGRRWVIGPSIEVYARRRGQASP
jgi:glycosyltransferase involved in cell wall biosynthesis/SAM-dependent methyltransferase